MKIILETERLYLREFIDSDGSHFFHLNNNPEVLKFTGNDPFKSIDEANDFMRNYSDYEKNGFGRWAVCLKATDEFLGWCGLKFENDENQTDLGFRFYKNNWGKGYATEAAIACVEYGFMTLKLKKIIGRAYAVNKASIKVLEKCKFKFEKEFSYDNQPSVFYAIENDRDKKN